MTPKEFYQNLSDGIKEDLKNCKSLEEARRVLEDASIELDQEVLEAISGGCGPGDGGGEGNGEGNDGEGEGNGLAYWIIHGGGKRDDKGGGC